MDNVNDRVMPTLVTSMRCGLVMSPSQLEYASAMALNQLQCPRYLAYATLCYYVRCSPKGQTRTVLPRPPYFFLSPQAIVLIKIYVLLTGKAKQRNLAHT